MINTFIFKDTFQGKLAEFAMYQYMKQNNLEVSKPDLSKEKLGKWDVFDITCYGKMITVKSTKHFGQLLLLETKDWTNEGDYKPTDTHIKSLML